MRIGRGMFLGFFKPIIQGIIPIVQHQHKDDIKEYQRWDE